MRYRLITLLLALTAIAALCAGYRWWCPRPSTTIVETQHVSYGGRMIERAFWEHSRHDRKLVGVVTYPASTDVAAVTFTAERRVKIEGSTSQDAFCRYYVDGARPVFKELRDGMRLQSVNALAEYHRNLAADGWRYVVESSDPHPLSAHDDDVGRREWGRMVKHTVWREKEGARKLVCPIWEWYQMNRFRPNFDVAFVDGWVHINGQRTAYNHRGLLTDWYCVEMDD